MTTIPSALAEAYSLLRNDLYEHIDAAEFLATKVADWRPDDVALAREMIPDLADVIRTVLARHKPDSHGNCTLCHDDWPCTTVQVVHEQLQDPKRTFARLTDPGTGGFR